MGFTATNSSASDLRAVGTLLRSGVSVLAFCAFAASPAYAQTDPAAAEQTENTAGTAQTDQTGEAGISQSTETQAEAPAEGDEGIVVTGIRQSLQNAQNMKRRADTVVDAITAEDIGALPDRSVTEALQRVPGVSINRFAGANDPDHFSGEGSGVVVRGLTYVRSEFNGRDTFSPGVGGQSINFQDVPADMLGSVQVWKNSTAEMIEGGLSGTVNMNLRLPFDQKGFFAGFSAEGVRTDMRKKWSPVFSGVISNTWETEGGRFGLLGAISYSKLFTRADNIRVSNFQTRDGRYAVQSNTADTLICRNPLPASTDAQGFPPTIPSAGNGSPCFGNAPAGANGFADYLPLAYAPLGGQFATQEYDRTRRGYAASAQWESSDRRALLTAQFLRSHATQEWGEHTFEVGGDLSEYNTYPLGCQPNNGGPPSGGAGTVRAQCPPAALKNYQYDEDGVFESGYITLPVGGWRGNIDRSFPNSFQPTGTEHYVGNRVPGGGMQHTLNRRQVEDENIVNDFGLNFKFTPNDRWAFNVDAQHVRAKHNNLDFTVTGSIFADQELDLTGEYPNITPHKPQQLGLWATWSQNSKVSPALAGASDAEYFGNPRYTFWRSAMDHIERSTGRESAIRADAQYNFQEDIPFLRHAKFGARYSDRDQTVRNTTYNWGSLSEVWSGRAVHMDETAAGTSEQHDWGSNFFRGKTSAPPIGNYYAGDLIKDYDGTITFLKGVQQKAIDYSRCGPASATCVPGTPGFAPSWVPLHERPNAIPGTPFIPADIQPVTEKNSAAYMMLSFGQDEPLFGNVTLDGNIGLRYVRTEITSGGSIGAPSRQALGITNAFAQRCAPNLPPPPAPQIPQPPSGVCTLGEAGYAQLQQFATGITEPNMANHTYDYFLPSLNMKFGLTQDVILRLAAGRNLARANMGDIRNFLTIGGGGGDQFQLTATAGNPFLKPAISDNYDASLEWYFGGNGVGSLTLNLFAKDIHNFFYQSIVERQVTSNGVTFPVYVRGPANYNETGKIRGMEIAYQQTFDFLPGPLNGLGISANYSYIKSKGLQGAQLDQGSPSPIGTAQNLPLEQLSKHNVNINPFYEKGPISLRVAYNWRSRFLLTASDVIFPYYPIYNAATGRVDATLFVKLNENFKVGVQGVNLTNEVTKTLQQFSTTGLLGPRSYFMEDRRFHLILRGNF